MTEHVWKRHPNFETPDASSNSVWVCTECEFCLAFDMNHKEELVRLFLGPAENCDYAQVLNVMNI